MGPIWDRQDPGGPHVGPMKFVTWAIAWINVDLTQSLMNDYVTIYVIAYLYMTSNDISIFVTIY